MLFFRLLHVYLNVTVLIIIPIVHLSVSLSASLHISQLLRSYGQFVILSRRDLSESHRENEHCTVSMFAISVANTFGSKIFSLLLERNLNPN